MFKALFALVETQFSAKIKILQSDSGGEYMSNEFQFFLQSHGIMSQRSCPFTLQQNGVAERKNHHLFDVVRTLLIESCVPSHFWCEALSTTVYLITRLPSPNLNNDSPYFRLFGHAPNYSNLHIFCCVCFVHIFLQHLILFCPFPMIPLLFVEVLDLTNLLKGMVFQLLWLCLLLCLLFPFPLVINRLENMSAGNKQWRLNFMHLRPIILGTLILVLQMSSPLVASGFIL